ncbi:hypothetical protein SLU01_19250 [Sporosarcina luteola]|uniref:Uncharacterized protein n=1 Tax=Sporosarcina luteola TaxID=582850 RepID=A0A511Z844_9BACL|nr:hypothetical protein [Sporosarcina luteola]GEN83613.1 hypothetical protein SLU01_19250 [Sporosarcina luteola]
MRTLQDQLKEKGFFKDHNTEVKLESGKSWRRKPEKLSDRDLRELMGTNRPTYGRKKGGAIRQIGRGR